MYTDTYSKPFATEFGVCKGIDRLGAVLQDYLGRQRTPR
jgi:hypothetical protein